MDLSQKGAHISINEFNHLTVTLSWTAGVDLDLLVFYKRAQDQTGVVCSEQYVGGSSGSLQAPPHIKLSGDAGVGGAAGDNREVVQIAHLDEFEQLCVCALNYTDTVAGGAGVFADYDARVEVRTERGDAFVVTLDSGAPGPVAMICKLLPTFLGSDLVNKSEVMSLERMRQVAPGGERFEARKVG